MNDQRSAPCTRWPISILRGSKSTEPHRVSVTVTFYMLSDMGTVDLAVQGYEPEATPLEAVDRTKEYVLVRLHRAITRRGGRFECWWAEDEYGNVLASGDDYQRPRRPGMWS
ncbi:hypothetical protein [Mycolicibacterium fortuitum]|uniref:hypothetical protein n=2 Tax=Mycolicibacterium fortuitum TaxID=1766 RepID=UPI00262F3E62|nr:hypothetical protein [Mycolicibacterium fortuitum]